MGAFDETLFDKTPLIAGFQSGFVGEAAHHLNPVDGLATFLEPLNTGAVGSNAG